MQHIISKLMIVVMTNQLGMGTAELLGFTIRSLKLVAIIHTEANLICIVT